jgi:hypothetical protein
LEPEWIIFINANGSNGLIMTGVLSANVFFYTFRLSAHRPYSLLFIVLLQCVCKHSAKPPISPQSHSTVHHCSTAETYYIHAMDSVPCDNLGHMSQHIWLCHMEVGRTLVLSPTTYNMCRQAGPKQNKACLLPCLLCNFCLQQAISQQQKPSNTRSPQW